MGRGIPSNTGRPAISPRLALPPGSWPGFLCLEHVYGTSDAAMVVRSVENPYFQHRSPIDPSSLTRWRGRIGEEGVEWLLTNTIEAGLG